MNVHPKRIKWIVRRLIVAGSTFVFLMLIVAGIQHRKASDTDLVLIDFYENGAHFLTEKDILDVVIRNFGSPLEGKNVGEINVAEVEKVIESNPFVHNADVYIDALSRVNVKVEEREPIVRILSPDSEDFYLDKLGGKIPVSSHYSARCLMATGNVGRYQEAFLETEGHPLASVFRVAKYIESDEFLSAQIEQLHIDSKQEITLAPKMGDHKVILGYADELETKFYRLKIFYKEGLAYEGWNKYNTINLKFADQVVAQ